MNQQAKKNNRGAQKENEKQQIQKRMSVCRPKSDRQVWIKVRLCVYWDWMGILHP